MAFIDENFVMNKKDIILKEYNSLEDITEKVKNKFYTILNVMSRDIPFKSCFVDYFNNKLFINFTLTDDYDFIVRITDKDEYIETKMSSFSYFCLQKEYIKVTTEQFNKGLTFSSYGGYNNDL